MKLLYISSIPDKEHLLYLGPEISEMQKRILETSGSVDVVFMPGITFSEMTRAIKKEKPDILHIAMHGNNDTILAADESGVQIRIDAELLHLLLDIEHKPYLIYLNACNSCEIARKLSEWVPAAIGTTAPMNVASARAAAVAFYDRIFDGWPVSAAFEAARKIMRSVTNDKVSIEIHLKAGIALDQLTLHTPLRLIAEFTHKTARKTDAGEYDIRFGLIGCPHAIRQVVFFTDDVESIQKELTLQESLCSVTRDPPRRGLLMLEGERNEWQIDGDMRLYATAVTGEGQAYTVSGMLCDALEHRYRLSHGEHAPSEVIAAVADLRSKDGSKLL